MKKVRSRAGAVLVICLAVVVLLGFFVARLALHGGEWASFRSNGDAYAGGKPLFGSIVDRNGVTLFSAVNGESRYAGDETVRRATLHAIGDMDGNIGTGAVRMYAGRLLGYDFFNGLYTYGGTGGKVTLSLDANVCAAALEALGDRSGAVAVMDYLTGEIICMVSTPTFDPEDPPEIGEDDTSGVYLNRVLSSTFTPGSVFKLVTLAAAMENIDDLFERDFHCDGSLKVGEDRVTCAGAHGDMKIEDALAKSCNCTFAALALELGGETLAEYAERFGLTARQSVDGIGCAAGRFDVGAEPIDLAWSGVGQYHDLVNPAAMLRFVAAIAGGGCAPSMTLLKGEGGSNGTRLLSYETAARIGEMMDYCVVFTYGDENFPGLALRAKSGTAEVGGGSPNAWFVGFIENPEHPYAFVVCIENGGGGASQAGPVANAVLQAAVG